MNDHIFDELRLSLARGRQGGPAQSVSARTRRRRRTQRRTQWAKAVAAAATTHVKLAGEAANAMVAAAPSEQPKKGRSAREATSRFRGLPCRPATAAQGRARSRLCITSPSHHPAQYRTRVHPVATDTRPRVRVGRPVRITAHSSFEASHRSARVDVAGE